MATPMSGEAKTDRIKVRRIPERGIYDQNVINEILDAG